MDGEMASTNPYIQAWSSEAGGSSSGAFFPTLVPQVSTAPTPDFITFHITSFNPTILNSTIYAPHSRPFLQVTTQERVTRLTDHAGSCIALIEWARNPIVEIKDSVPRLYAGAWLKLSQDNLYRSMAHGDDKYKWIPSGPYVLLYNMTPSPPEIVAKLARTADAVSVGMIMSAMHVPGLPHAILTAALLLQSGQNID